MKTAVYIFLFIATFGLCSCDDVIHPTLQSADPVYAIDAFIDNKLDTQVVRVMFSQPYFDEVLPPGVSGAVVTITDNENNAYSFEELPGEKGSYIWLPAGTGFGKVGNDYTLTIDVNGETFNAQSHMGRVPKVDSITFEKSDRNGDRGDYYTGQFWAVDPKGVGDTYWIKTYKNGVFLNKPREINLAYDATFTKGTFFDGFTFVQPIRSGINPTDVDANDNLISPFTPGDFVRVEIYSLTEASFAWLNEVALQTNRPGGFSELFARPLANVSTNIKNVNPSGTKAQGFFNVGSASALSVVFEK